MSRNLLDDPVELLGDPAVHTWSGGSTAYAPGHNTYLGEVGSILAQGDHRASRVTLA